MTAIFPVLFGAGLISFLLAAFFAKPAGGDMRIIERVMLVSCAAMAIGGGGMYLLS